MIRYTSTRSHMSPVTFDQAVLSGFAEDGGLFVPEKIPEISAGQLSQWSELSFTDLALEMLSLFINPELIPKNDLEALIGKSFSGFNHPDIIPLVPLGGDPAFQVMELFHGPTLSFKDVAMGFLAQVMDYFLQKDRRHVSLVLATTGDTGPAAAYAAAGMDTIDCWPLYPLGMISEEQERQMTTLTAPNIHPVAVSECPNGGDDLDLVVAALFSDRNFARRAGLSSVNSINWCRVMVQAVHYAYGYFRACRTIGDPVVFAVPSGAFGNLFAGWLARQMGIPADTFICATNRNRTLPNVFATGRLEKTDLVQTVSSAIDIVVPYNFWRFLYFNAGCDPEKINRWMTRFEEVGSIDLDDQTRASIQQGFAAHSVSDAQTLAVMHRIYRKQGYLLDPHGAVAVSAAEKLKTNLDPQARVVCLATAHPAKFPDIVLKALGEQPEEALHPSLELAQNLPQNRLACRCEDLETVLKQHISKRVCPDPVPAG